MKIWSPTKRGTDRTVGRLGLAGSLTFLVYSIAIAAYPIAIVNVIAAAIHGWYLRKVI